jgi:hypothetical protein
MPARTFGVPPRFRTSVMLRTSSGRRRAWAARPHADARPWCDLTRRVALSGASREQRLARRVEVFDIGEGHRPPALAGWIESDLEAVDVVADVVRLVGVR